MEEPLKHYYKKYGFDKQLIKSFAVGLRYLGIMLTNGHIGVCAIQHNEVNLDFDNFSEPDLSQIDHRIFYTAYLNAVLNYKRTYNDQKDIFDLIDFNTFENIVMIGYFRPLVKKFQNKNLQLRVFDLFEEDAVLCPLNDRTLELQKADCIILTSTSIFNNTFLEITDLSPQGSSIFLLGPSSILHEDMLKFRNIKKVFGIEFNQQDDRILQVIRENHGTPVFSPFGKKVYI